MAVHHPTTEGPNPRKVKGRGVALQLGAQDTSFLEGPLLLSGYLVFGHRIYSLLIQIGPPFYLAAKKPSFR